MTNKLPLQCSLTKYPILIHEINSNSTNIQFREFISFLMMNVLTMMSIFRMKITGIAFCVLLTVWNLIDLNRLIAHMGEAMRHQADEFQALH